MDIKKILLITGGALFLVLVIVVVFIFVFMRKSGPVTLTYWGLWEPNEVFQTVIADYQRLHPGVLVKYTKQTPLNYRDHLTTALAGQNGPDIFRIHSSWLPMYRTSLATIPSNIYSSATYKSTFYPVAQEGYPYTIPLEVDNIALYVNDEIFRAGGVEVPTTWDGENGLLAIAQKLTVKDTNGRIKTSGASLGTTSNVDHWQEIIALMMAQAGDYYNSAALGYYTNFAASRIWDETLDNSTLSFANGNVAMYFGPSWRYFDIKLINPKLNFHIAPVPQLVGGQTVNYATYWTEGVSKKSPNQKAAFEFLKYLSSKDVLAKLYAAETKVRGFGEPYSRVDMASLLTPDPTVSPFILAAPTSKGWYLASGTFDGETGINSRIGKYYLDAINSVLKGGNPTNALDTVKKGVLQVLGQ